MHNENQNLFMDDCTSVEANILSSTNHRDRDPTPPKITSTLNKGKAVIVKPIAFKPLTRRFADNEGQHYGSTPILARPSSNITHYGSSHDLHKHTKHHTLKIERKLRSVSPIAMSSLPLSSNHKLRIGYDSMDNIRKTLKDCNSVLSKSYFRTLDRTSASEDSGSLLDLTPSPSESNSFAEMEAALRERDYELSYLRQTMEHNEQVIFKVYQEKENAYERELRKLKTLYENRLRAASQKSLKLEQMLMMQTYQLQEDKKRLREENVEALSEISALREEISSLRVRLEETEWSLCQKSGELAHIKSQLKDTQGEQTNRGQEVINLKKEICQLRNALEEKEIEICSLRDALPDKNIQFELNTFLEEVDNEISDSVECKKDGALTEDDDNNKKSNFMEKLKTKLNFFMNEWNQERKSWDQERKTWACEKEKVLCYQKQLQISYIEMFRRNRVLESELENISINDYDINSERNHKKEIKKLTQPTIQL